LGFSAGLRRLRRQGDDLADPARRRTPGFVTPSLALAPRVIAAQAGKLAAVALANKIARIAWKLMTSAERYAGAPQPAAIA
jgi:hypothetical protein